MSAPRASQRLFSGLLFFTALLSVGLPLRAAPAPEQDSYYGVYLQGAKIGSVTSHRTDIPAVGGKPALTKMDSVLSIEFNVMGTAASLTNRTVSVAETKSGRPISQESRTEGAGRVTLVTANYTDRSVRYVANIQGSEKSGTLTLKPGESFLLDTSDSPDFHPQVGMELKGKLFVPEGLQLTDMSIKVVGQEAVRVGTQTVSAYKIVESSPAGGTTTSYMNEAGDLLRATIPLGMEICKEPKETALAPRDGSVKAPDLISLTAITPTGTTITSPRSAQTARYVITGASRRLPPTDAVQTVDYAPAASGAPAPADAPAPTTTMTVTVTARPLPVTGGRLYPSPEQAPAPLRPYLGATAYAASDSPIFRKLAKQIVGEETDTAKAAARIATWVHTHVKPDPGIAAFRSATDVYNDPRGVCRDYTVYFTAIARAAGIPTKQCVGVVFADGSFFFHAWPEVWVGGANDASSSALPNYWIALEPTLGFPYADATHIKLAEGELTAVTSIASDIGNYRIRVDSIR